jgi:hypothetical protein
MDNNEQRRQDVFDICAKPEKKEAEHAKCMFRFRNNSNTMYLTCNWLAWSRLRRKSGHFLPDEAALRSKKSAKYGGKWAFLGQTACHLTSYAYLITTNCV